MTLLAPATIARKARRWAARLRGATADIIYHPGYAAPYNHLADRQRAMKILAHLTREGFTHPRHVYRPRQASLHELGRVHRSEYLEGLEAPERLVGVFAEQLSTDTTAIVIEQQRLMVGGTLLAARRALHGSGPRTVVNLGGGLHHAHDDHGAGFCLFNDVAVAVKRLRADGFEGRVLVIDLDLHQGDGTRRIFASDESVFTLSMHAVDWDSEDAIADLNLALGPGIGDRAYLEALDEALPQAFERARPDLVLYLAGVDVAADDQLGNWWLSGEAILRRDQRVQEWIGERPSVWLLAGGYGPDAWRHSARSLGWLLTGRDRPIPSEADAQLDQFRQVARSFQRWELTGKPQADFEITAEDLLGDLWQRPLATRLLGFYSAYGIELALDRYGVLEHLRSLGYPRVRVSFDLDHPTGQRVRLHSDDRRNDLLIELLLKEARLDTPYRLLYVEWLLLQNPRAQPTAERPLLPGQTHPGLGCLNEIGLMLVMACERLEFDGLVFTPSHYHLAAQAKGRLRFVDPHRQGMFLAMQGALEGCDLLEATEIVANRGLVDAETRQPVAWKAAPMALPVSERLKSHFESAEYEQIVETTAQTTRLVRRDAQPQPASQRVTPRVHLVTPA